MISFDIPWPHPDLSPNARVHRMAVSGVRKSYRSHCGWLAVKAHADAGRPQLGAVTVSLAFHAPDKRRRDLDNALASIKAGLDGIADAIGVDDHKWGLAIKFGDPIPGGSVAVTITETAAVAAIPLRGTIT
jgi:crossover junction endodeoxyribonuclease RusA